MADFADIASALEEADRERSLAAHMRAADELRATEAHGPAGSECEDCGGEIEPRRQAVLPNTRLCAECARDVERLARRSICRM
jgi:DnaK suppressor protein